MHKVLSTAIVASGLALMMTKIYADSEPGLIPILLIFVGLRWYFITQLRTQSQHK